MAAQVTYKLSEFNKSLAASGGLCVMVKKDVTNTDATNPEYTISNIVINDNNEVKVVEEFKGAGICRLQANNIFEFTVDSIPYLFNDTGDAYSGNAIGYKLMMGEVVANISSNGSNIKSNVTSIITRNRDGSVASESIKQESSTKWIDSLNARDQFAIQAMVGMLSKIPHPESLSNNEINYYCNAAYQWAANMMSLAADARSFTTVNSGSKAKGDISDTTVDNNDSTKKEEVDILDSNVEKLLNNIIAALEKTDSKFKIDNKEVYAERQSNPEWNELWKNYVKHTAVDSSDTQTSVGLDDLVKAIKNIQLKSSDDTLKVTIPDVSLVSFIDSGMGGSRNKPIYVESTVFPSRQTLAAYFDEDKLHSFLTFNTDGAVGYSTRADVNGELGNYTDVKSLSDAVFNSVKGSIQTLIDERCKAWLSAAKVTINGTEYSLTVNTPA